MNVGICTSLSALLDGIVPVLPEDFDLPVTGLALDSRRVSPGNVFCARAGSRIHGMRFIDEAITKGAVAVLTEGAKVDLSHYKGVPVITLPHFADHLGRCAARFYGNHSHHLLVVGVTGTNGKTSITQLLAQIINRDATTCAVIGTLGVGFPEDLYPTTHTTPDAIALQKIIADLSAQGAQQLVIEVSSHALDQGRVAGVTFDVAIFTNLTRDHLDYHGNMEAYGLAKQRLFHVSGLKYAVINTDDAFGHRLLSTLPPEVTAVTYGLSHHGEAAGYPLPVRGHGLALSSTGLRMAVTTPWGDGMLQSSLLGRFNASNLLAVLATLGILGMALDEALFAISRLHTVPGRMETFGGGHILPLVVVDYAHTPDALEQVLVTLREHTSGSLYCIFGCGGERDRGKRPLMGAVAERLADDVVITNDNPRGEDPEDIFRDIQGGIKILHHARLIPDRRLAIEYTITNADRGDVILVAGKGHEDYQQIGENRLPFSDRVEVERALAILVTQSQLRQPFSYS